MGKIIAVVNQKGGVGKTTTAVNLTAILADMGQRVLVVDLDPQGNTTSGLGRKAGDKSIYEALLGREPLRGLHAGYGGAGPDPGGGGYPPGRGGAGAGGRRSGGSSASRKSWGR